MADTKTIMSEAENRMQRAIDHLEEELINVRAGKATPNVLNGVTVDYYGSMTPVSGVASVTVPDAKTILIQPWDKKMIKLIEKAILDSNIGLTPSNNGEQIRLTIPPLTEERRKQLVKQVRQEAETARVSLRNARRDALESFKKAQKEGMPEDESKDGETQIQKLLERYTKLLDAAQQFVAPLGESYLSLLSLMKTTAGTGGFFYQVFTSGKQEYILLKNGGDSNQMLLGPSQWYQEKSIQALGNGSFLLSTVSRKKTERKWGLPRDLREKAAAGPNDIVRAVRIDFPGEFRVFKLAGIYRLSFPVTPQLVKDLPPELLLEKATARLPEKKKADAIEFLRKTVQFTSRDLAGRKISFVEFPLSRQSISLWIEFFRRLRDEKMAAAIPHVLALEPANGAQNVDPNLSEIRVTFDRPMSPNSWSFCQRGADNFPDFLAKPSFNADRTVITVPVRLRPEWNYYIFLNSPPFLGFRSAQGGILPAVPWSFSTGKLPASGAGNGSGTTEIDHKNIRKQ